MKAEQFRNAIAALGTELSPDMIAATQKLIAPLHSLPSETDGVERDQPYGPHERHRADIFSAPDIRDAPVLVFVHGGGFVMGDKRTPGTPFYDNVGRFAVDSGFVGVTVTYRLAPEHKWPAGPQDMALLVEWLHDNIARFGGDPARIFLMGQSAGAVHVASYLAHKQFHRDVGSIAGAIAVSAIYDVAAAHANQFHTAYYGEDRSQYALASLTGGLSETQVPFMATVSEFDILDFQSQSAQFVADYQSARGTYPAMHYLSGHNHLSPALALGSDFDTLGPLVAAFINSRS